MRTAVRLVSDHLYALLCFAAAIAWEFRFVAQPAEHGASCIHSAMHAIHRSHVQISFEGHMIPAADAPPHYQYGCAIYWAFTTFTTIGTAQCREGHLCVCIFTGTAG